MTVNSPTKRLVVLAVLLACSLILFLIESLFPPLFALAPYVKIGLSNCILLYVLINFGVGEAYVFMLAKNLLGSLICGFYAFPFNIAGSFCSLTVMCLLYKLLYPKISVVCISVSGAVVSNIARTLVAALIMSTKGLLVQMPIVCLISLPAGILVGFLTILMIKYLPKLNLTPKMR